jgi:predicted secreted hydrolase
MTMGYARVKKSQTKHREVKVLQSLLIIALTITLTQSASIGSALLDKQWKTYPYHPPGTSIVFPTDEGSHNEKYQIEWWYANFHLKGQTTGNEYGAMVSFYKVQTKVFDNLEVRLFSISDLTQKQIYTNFQIGTLTASTDHLNLSFKNLFNNANDIENLDTNSFSVLQAASILNDQLGIEQAPLNQTIAENTILSNTTLSKSKNNSSTDAGGKSMNGLEPDNYWYTKSNGQDLLPFQYALSVGGFDKQIQQMMQLSVDMDCQKRPLIIGGTGLVPVGKDGFSYYYSLTKLSVTGTIVVHGSNEAVSGIAWVDHQWGNFSNQNPPPYALTVSIEWFSIKLDDNREIMVCDTWDQETGNKFNQSFPGLNLLNTDGSLELLKGYRITPQHFWNDDIDYRNFTDRWRINESSKSINLTIMPVFPDQVIRIPVNFSIIRQYLAKVFPAVIFWEGVCTVSGTINRVSVHGKAYVELTHSNKKGNDNVNHKP